jgi:hypothetical protein
MTKKEDVRRKRKKSINDDEKRRKEKEKILELTNIRKNDVAMYIRIEEKGKRRNK